MEEPKKAILMWALALILGVCVWRAIIRGETEFVLCMIKKGM